MDDLTNSFIKSTQKLDELSALAYRIKISTMLDQKQMQFPGSQPVSLEPRRDISIIASNPFKVCEKTDGTRFLLYFDLIDLIFSEQIVCAIKEQRYYNTRVLLIDRDNNFYAIDAIIRLYRVAELINAQISKDQNQDINLAEFLKLQNFSMLLDGEIVKDINPDTKEASLVFYVFDCLYFNGSYLSKPFSQRLERANNALIIFKKLGQTTELKTSQKKIVDKDKIQEIIDIKPHLHHHSDGFIFTAENDCYVMGTTQSMIKWKPKHENTVDVQVVLSSDDCYVTKTNQSIISEENLINQVLYQQQFHVAYHGIVEFEPIKERGSIVIEKASFDNAIKEQQRQRSQNVQQWIVEVFWDDSKSIRVSKKIGKFKGKNVYVIDQVKGGWKVIKHRSDKRLPNDRRVYESVLRSYAQYIDITEIIKIFKGELKLPGISLRSNPFNRTKKGLVKVIEDYQE